MLQICYDLSVTNENVICLCKCGVSRPITIVASTNLLFAEAWHAVNDKICIEAC